MSTDDESAPILPDIFTQYGEDFFNKLEMEIPVKLPKDLRKILLINDVNSLAVIAKVDEPCIRKMENFIQNDLIEDMLSNTDTLRDYLGLYVKCQKKFKFSIGQELLLGIMVDFCKEKLERNANTNTQPAHKHLCNSYTTTDEKLSCDESFKKTTNRDDDLFYHIGSLMITIFNDAKRTSLSSWSWPSRIVAAELANNFKLNRPPTTKFDLHYVTPSSYTALLEAIVESDIQNFTKSLKESLAVSLRLDGSVDRTQQHNVFVMVQIVKKNASVETLCIGFDIPNENGALGYLNCLKSITKKVLPWEQFFELITSLVTDGESLNMGRFNGLVPMLKDLRQISPFNTPLFSIWCVPHRTNLAWKSVSALNIIAKAITSANKLSTYFHVSGKRTQKLKGVALENGLTQPLRYPKLFAIRWIEFAYQLFNVVVRNWRATVKYFESENLTAKLNYWLQYDTLRFITFLTDILFLLKKFQKTCQSNSITLMDVSHKKDILIAKLENCKYSHIDGGWEELLQKTVVTDGNNVFLYDIKLRTTTTRTRRMPIVFTQAKRNYILHKLTQHLQVRLSLDDSLLEAFKPFSTFNISTSQEVLKMCHTIVAPDLDQNKFIEEYYDAAALLRSFANSQSFKICEYLKTLIQVRPDHLHNIKLSLARILAAKPHSADVERLISTYNKFKNPDRSSLSQQTLSNFLYVNANMGSLKNFDPTVAIKYWLAKKRRQPKSYEKAHSQEWFHGVFDEARKNIEEDNNIDPVIRF